MLEVFTHAGSPDCLNTSPCVDLHWISFGSTPSLSCFNGDIPENTSSSCSDSIPNTSSSCSDGSD